MKVTTVGGSLEIFGPADISRAIKRICHEIVEANHGLTDCVLLGIPTRGALLSNRMEKILAQIESPIPVGSLDITLYRDDLRIRPQKEITPTVIPTSGIEGKTVILVDDVLYSGRTVKAAFDALSQYGRPKKVQLAVLIDRGHRELPIRADYVGKNIPTATSETVRVRLSEIDGSDSVALLKGGETHA
jgi:pyrimidine operon attenuation protein / uracil phosphoribosyltransferase